MAQATPANMLDPIWTPDELRASAHLLDALAHHAFDPDGLIAAACASMVQALAGSGGCVFLTHAQPTLAHHTELPAPLVAHLAQLPTDTVLEVLTQTQAAFARHALTCLPIPLMSNTHVIGVLAIAGAPRACSAAWQARAGEWIGGALVRAREQHALRAANIWLQSFIENSSEAFWEGDFDGNILYVNDAACRMLEIPRARLLQLNAKAVYVESAAMHAAHQTLLEHGLIPSSMCQLRTGAGRVITVNYSSRLVRIPEAKGLRHQTIFHDVTEQQQLVAALNQRNHELAALNKIAMILSQPTALSDALTQVCEQIASLVGMESVVIYAMDSAQTFLTALAQYGLAADLLAQVHRVGLDDPLVRRIALEGHSVALSDVMTFPGNSFAGPRAAGYHAGIGVPIHRRDEPAGALFVGSQRAVGYQPSEVALLETIANQLGNAIEKTGWELETQARLRELEGLAKLSAACAASLDLDRVIQPTLYWTQTLLQADIADMRRLVGARMEPLPHGTRGAHLDFDHPIDLNTLATQFNEQRTPLILHEVDAAFDLPPPMRQLLLARNLRAMLVMPLIAQDQVIGLLSALQRSPRRWSAHEIELLRTIANQAANAIYNAQLFQQVVKEERRNTAIIESGLNGVYVTDRAGVITLFNHAAVSMTGWRQAEALGAHWADIFADVNDTPAETLIDRVMELRQPIHSVSGRVIRSRHGAPIPILEAAAPLFDEQGAVSGVVGTMWDLTREQQAELERADLLEFFTHELRTPLSNLVSIAQMLQAPTAPKTKRAEMLKLIQKEGRRLHKFADDLLYKKGAFAPSTPAVLTPLPLPPLLDSVIQRFRADDHTHRFRVKLPRPAPVALAEPERVEHILSNLLENAVNYAPDGTVITLTVTVQPAEIEIAVHDQGQGIPAEEQTLIFERYYRAKHSHGRVAGHGLGLAIVRKMVSELGGKIWVDSRPRHGATFRFTLRRKS